jgi:hypothetical protein
MVNPDQLFTDKLITKLGELEFNNLRLLSQLEAADAHIKRLEATVQDREQPVAD